MTWSLNENDFFITNLSFYLQFITNYSHRQAYVEINRLSKLLFLIISTWLWFRFLTESLFLSFFFLLENMLYKNSCSWKGDPWTSTINITLIYYLSKPFRWFLCMLKFENHIISWPLHGSLPCHGKGICVTQWSYGPCLVGPPKMDGS